MTDDVVQIQTRTGVLAGQSLAPCPFCGQSAQFTAALNWITAVDDDTGEESLGSSVSCDTCGTYGPPAFDGLFGAVAAWNRRVARA